MRKRELERLCIEWQVRLGLADWEIDLRPERDASVPGSSGTCDYDVHERTAEIYVDPRAKDPELVLVHELLHLWISPLCGRSTATVYEEQAIDAITKALVVALKRCAQ